MPPRQLIYNTHERPDTLSRLTQGRLTRVSKLSRAITITETADPEQLFQVSKHIAHRAVETMKHADKPCSFAPETQ